MRQARERKGVGLLAALFVLAFSVRAGAGAVLLSAGPAAFVLASDDGDAYDAAARWQAFGTPVAPTPRMEAKWDPGSSVMDRWPQGYWLFLAAQYALWQSAYASTIVLQALVGACGVLAGYALTRAVMSEGAAKLAGVALALSSTSVYLAAALYAESLYIPLVLGGLALAARVLTTSRSSPAIWLWPTLSGLAFGLAEATRPLALPIFVAVLGWCLWPKGRSTAHERVRAALGLGVGFVVGSSPFVAHDMAVLGRVATFTVGGAEAFSDRLRGPDTGLFDRLALLFVSGGWAPLGEPLLPILAAATLPLRFAQAALGAFGLAWLVRPGAKNWPIGWLLLLACLAILVPPLFLGLPLVRYRAAADPLIIVATVAVLDAVWRFSLRRPVGHSVTGATKNVFDSTVPQRDV